MKRLVLIGTAVMAMAVAPAWVGAQTSAPKSSGSPDVDFVIDAAKGGMAEVELGKLAQDKASSEDVKNFAKRMVDDHSKANDELQTLAKNKSITLPTDLDRKDKALKDRLAKLSGPSFDHSYMNAMIADHRKDVAEFKHEASAGKDPDVKAWAAKTLPTLEEHLKMAQDANKVVGTSGKKSTKKPVGK
jgi:putative membrane protein